MKSFRRITVGVIGLCVWFLGTSLQAELIIEDTFTGYLDNALISDSPAGPALGLTGDWSLQPHSGDFYVNRTQSDDDAGTGKAVYDMPSDYNGARIATRSTSADHVLFENDGDAFYASFLIAPARAGGDMTFELGLRTLAGGGALDFSFGIVNGQYIVGNGGVGVRVGGGTVTVGEQLVLVRIVYGDEATGLDDNELITMWVNPLDESSTPVLDGISADVLSSGGGKIQSISLRGDQMDGRPALFDNLRVGTTFADVVPEPSTFLLLAVGLIAFIPLARRRRR